MPLEERVNNMKKTNVLAFCAAMLLASCGGTTPTKSSEPVKTSETPAATSEVVDNTSAAPVVASSSTEEVSPDGEKTFVFEAEYNPYIENMSGPAFSGTYTGLDMIQHDFINKSTGELAYEASNGYYVTGLWKNGQTMAFTINSDQAVTGATFVWRISCECYNIALEPGFYDIYVNGEQINYKKIEINDVPSYQTGYRKFEDFTLTTKLALKEGENQIIFYTTNKTAMGGTMTATAPTFDCFKIKTKANLTWDPCLDNIEY